jgi:hypothetical protein
MSPNAGYGVRIDRLGTRIESLVPWQGGGKLVFEDEGLLVFFLGRTADLVGLFAWYQRLPISLNETSTVIFARACALKGCRVATMLCGANLTDQQIKVWLPSAVKHNPNAC